MAHLDFFFGRMERDGTLETHECNSMQINVTHSLLSPISFLMTSQEAHFHRQQVGHEEQPTNSKPILCDDFRSLEFVRPSM